MFFCTIPASILSFVFVALILVAMATVLLGIHNLFLPGDNSENRDTDKLKQEVEDRDEVITGGSVFHDFLARDKKEPNVKNRKTATANSSRKVR